MSAQRRVAIQMDPLDTIDITADSSFRMGIEAQIRGHELFFYLPKHLSYRDGVVSARMASLRLADIQGRHFELGPLESHDLREMDVVLMRQDPPFDMAYITATHVLEMVHPLTLVVNDPFHVRNAPEKLYVTQYAEFMPSTLISSDVEEIKAFRAEHGDIILKPLYGNGGAGVFRLRPEDENMNALLEMFGQSFREPLIAQAYLPAVREGDKRIILVDGEPVGALNRIPAQGESRSNLHVGGQAVKSELTDREQEICARLGPDLKAKGLIFVGIDVIGGLLTEINVTSPTGIQEIERFDGTNIAAQIWDAIEGRLPG